MIVPKTKEKKVGRWNWPTYWQVQADNAKDTDPEYITEQKMTKSGYVDLMSKALK